VPGTRRAGLHLCREPEGLAYTLENLEHLVVKAVGEAGGYGMLVGPHASREEREAFADKLRAKPENYISQPTLALSRAPCLVEGRLEARHVDLRPFVLHGEDTRVVPGGLCRVALRLQEIALVDVWRRDPAMLYRDVIQAVQLFDGICASSMRQDTGWHFMRLGRFIERVQLVGSLLEAHCAATKGPSEGKGDWVGLLWACDAFEAYCQLHGAQIREEKVLDFLVYDAGLPHALCFAVNGIRGSLEAIDPPAAGRISAAPHEMAGRLASILSRQTTSLAVGEKGRNTLNDLVTLCRVCHETLERTYMSCPTEFESVP
jgi:hypothetical protein